MMDHRNMMHKVLAQAMIPILQQRMFDLRTLKLTPEGLRTLAKELDRLLEDRFEAHLITNNFLAITFEVACRCDGTLHFVVCNIKGHVSLACSNVVVTRLHSDRLRHDWGHVIEREAARQELEELIKSIVDRIVDSNLPPETVQKLISEIGER